MLHKLDLIYDDGRKETKIVHTTHGEQVEIFPKRDGITFCNCKTFKYEFDKHPTLCPAIVKLGDRHVIMPWGVICHPETNIEDIHIKVKRKNKPTVKIEKWEFESDSGGGTYVVSKQGDKLKCDCMGFWRSKGNCKHVKEVRNL